MTIHKYMIQKEEQGQRIDKVLFILNPEQSRSQVQDWIKQNLVKVNSKTIKSNYKCKENDQITWEEPLIEELELIPENIPLNIVYEDIDIIVVNKGRNMVVHPSAGHTTGTLVHALLYHCKDLSGINSVIRPGIVHRIDKDTSGLLVVAKNDQAHQNLSEQLADREVNRVYESITHGVIEHDKGLIDAPIGRDPKDRQKMGVVTGGKKAITNFIVQKRFPKYTHVECKLETGRTHQIRVHMKYIEHPIVGDLKYGPKKTLKIDGQALHAKQLGFHHPVTNKWMDFTVNPPKYFQDLLAQLDNMY